jgi:AraC-like DNA-binding protein
VNPQKKTSTHYVTVLVRCARKNGLDIDQILADIGIPLELSEAGEGWIDNHLVTALVKQLWRVTGNETFGFDPVPLKAGTWAIACEFMLGADTLGELYRKGERVLEFLAPKSAGLKVVSTGESVSILPQMYIGESDPDHLLVEFLSILWHRFPSWAIDEKIELQAAFFSYPRPEHGQLYDELFHCDVTFEQASCGFSFHSKYLQKPITRSSLELENWLRDSPADLLYMPGRESSIQSQLKGQLRKALKETMRYPAFEVMCGDLCMSPQVVRRRLGEEGTSYQRIKDSVRCDEAKGLLKNPEIPIMDIAERTGFSESAAFSRAFKKWTGVTPALYRATIAASD